MALPSPKLEVTGAADPHGEIMPTTYGGVQFETGTTVGGSRAAAVNRSIWSFGSILGGFGSRDPSQTLGNGCRIHLGGFLRPGDHSGPISDHF